MIEESFESQILKLQAQLKQISQANADIVIKLGGLAQDMASQQEELKESIESEIVALNGKVQSIESKLAKSKNSQLL
jgi:hypothetical protein